MTAACINVHINDEPPTLATTDTDFSSILSEYPSMTAEQLSVLTLLGSVFYIRSNPYWMRNIYPTPLIDNMELNIGELVDSTSDPSHPENSLTLYTYTEDTLKNSFKRDYPPNYPGTPEEWGQLVDNTSFDNMAELMNNYIPGTCSFEKTPLKISFSSATAEEIQTYANNKDGMVPIYSDAYPWLKSFVGNEAQGYSRPNSTPVSTTTLNGREVISFETQVYLLIDFPNTGERV